MQETVSVGAGKRLDIEIWHFIDLVMILTCVLQVPKKQQVSAKPLIED
jgi:hypothetical protein